VNDLILVRHRSINAAYQGKPARQVGIGVRGCDGGRRRAMFATVEDNVGVVAHVEVQTIRCEYRHVLKGGFEFKSP